MSKKPDKPIEENFEQEEIQLPEELRERPKEPVNAEFAHNKVVIVDKRETVYEPGFYGKMYDNRLELSLVEALLLLKRGRIRVLNDGKEMTFEELSHHGCKVDERMPERYRVYEDLRERGLLVRTGFKFGCDFRVYERGVKLKKGPKRQKEHTKWIVFSVEL